MEQLCIWLTCLLFCANDNGYSTFYLHLLALIQFLCFSFTIDDYSSSLVIFPSNSNECLQILILFFGYSTSYLLSYITFSIRIKWSIFMFPLTIWWTYSEYVFYVQICMLSYKIRACYIISITIIQHTILVFKI